MYLQQEPLWETPSPIRWAEARIKIARMTLTIKLDGNWSSFQLANSTPPLSVTGSAIAPSARMVVACAFHVLICFEHARIHWFIGALLPLCKILDCQNPEKRHNQKKSGMAFSRCILFFYLSVWWINYIKRRKAPRARRARGAEKYAFFERLCAWCCC